MGRWCLKGTRILPQHFVQVLQKNQCFQYIMLRDRRWQHKAKQTMWQVWSFSCPIPCLAKMVSKDAIPVGVVCNFHTHTELCWALNVRSRNGYGSKLFVPSCNLTDLEWWLHLIKLSFWHEKPLACSSTFSLHLCNLLRFEESALSVANLVVAIADVEILVCRLK